MSSVMPAPEQMSAMAESGHQGPIVMVNLLKYRATAGYAATAPEARQGLTGREAYQRYGRVAMKCLAEIGASIVWAGQQKFVFIGGGEQEWDEVICVRYPSRQKFLEMVSRPDYLAGTCHRDAGLERTVLLCCEAGTAS